MASGSSSSGCWAASSITSTSRSAFQLTSCWVRLTTNTVCTSSQPSRASSTTGLSGSTLPRRQPPSAVITALQPPSSTRSRIELALKPPKITEWMAPRRAQASTAKASSGIMGM